MGRFRSGLPTQLSFNVVPESNLIDPLPDIFRIPMHFFAESRVSFLVDVARPMQV